jgi:hypothetical protein
MDPLLTMRVSGRTTGRARLALELVEDLRFRTTAVPANTLRRRPLNSLPRLW